MRRGILILLVALVAAVAVWLWFAREDVAPPEADGPTPDRPPAVTATPPARPSARPRKSEREADEAPALPSPAGPKPAGAPARPGAWRLRGVCRTDPKSDGKPVRPVANARVTVWKWGGIPNRIAEVVADAEGRYEAPLDALKDLFPAVRGGTELFVRAQKDGWMTPQLSWLEGSLPVEDDRPFEPTRDLTLMRFGWITGRVLDTRGHPVAEAEIQVLDDPKELDSSYPSDRLDLADGRFSAPSSGEGKHWVILRSDGVGVSTVCTIDAGPHAHVDLGDITLRPAGTIGGIASYADGTPARYLVLNISSPEHQGSIFPVGAAGYRETARTDEWGRFRAVALHPADYEVSSDESEKYPTLKVKLGTTNVRYRLSTPRVLLRVRDDRSRPVRGVKVQVMRWRGAAAEARKRALRGASLYDVSDQAVDYYLEDVVWPDGILGLPARAGEFWVIGIHHAGIVPVTRSFEIPAGVFETVIDLTLRRATQLGRMVFAFEKSGGPAPEEFRVWVASPLTRLEISDCSGPFAPGERLPGLAPGRYRVAVYPRDTRDSFFLGVHRTVDLKQGDNVIRLPVRPAGRLSVKVVMAPHTDTEAARKSLRVRIISFTTNEVADGFERFGSKPWGRWRDERERDPRGRTYYPDTSHANLAVGRYRVRATAEGVLPVEQEVTIEPGKHPVVTLYLR